MITVQANANDVIKTSELSGDTGILDSNDNAFAYMADAMMAFSLIIAHAETKYGPNVANNILSTLEGYAMRKALNKHREEMRKVDQTENCSVD